MPVVRDRQEALRVAWAPIQLISEGRVDEGMSLFDDVGTWWDLATRTAVPIREMRAGIAATVQAVPLRFELIGSVVEGNRVVLLVDSHGLVDGKPDYHNCYALVMDLNPERDTIAALREYDDTLHASKVLLPALLRAAEAQGPDSSLAARATSLAQQT